MSRSRIAAPVAIVVLLLATAPAAVNASDRSYDSVVKHIQDNYGAKRQGALGLISFARFLVQVIRPAGVKDFKLTMLKGLDHSFASESENHVAGFQSPFDSIVDKEWRQLVRYISRKNHQSTFVYVRQLPKDVKLLIVTMQPTDAFVVEVRFSPEKLAAFMNDPKILGIRLSDDRPEGNQSAQPVPATN
jgi:hypothetical protein